MDYSKLDDQLAYSDLILKVANCAEERYARSENFDYLNSYVDEKALLKAVAMAVVECIDDKDMWIIIHHNCHNVYKAFYAGSLEYCLSSPYDVFLNDCRKQLIGKLEFIRNLVTM